MHGAQQAEKRKKEAADDDAYQQQQQQLRMWRWSFSQQMGALTSPSKPPAGMEDLIHKLSFRSC